MWYGLSNIRCLPITTQGHLLYFKPHPAMRPHISLCHWWYQSYRFMFNKQASPPQCPLSCWYTTSIINLPLLLPKLLTMSLFTESWQPYLSKYYMMPSFKNRFHEHQHYLPSTHTFHWWQPPYVITCIPFLTPQPICVIYCFYTSAIFKYFLSTL